ncbi:MAG: glycerate kinase [Chitinophagaceae bacterium]|jgi:glycerate kinase
MRIVIAPDKFKGSIDSISLCSLLHKEIVVLYPDATVDSYPLSDGGDGFAQIVQHYFKTQTVSTQTVDPLGRPIVAKYQYAADTQTAYIEMAAASGLALLKESEYNVMRTSTYGTGLMIRDAIVRGAQHIVIGIGGSATNDGGIGMADALGYMFLDKNEDPLEPCGENLSLINELVLPENDLLEDIQFTVAYDVVSPLIGPDGAAKVFAKQKGASDEEIDLLEEGLKHLDDVFIKFMGRSIAEEPGAGAAGGLGGGCDIFLGARLVSGIDYLIEEIALEQAIQEADIVLTGEGRLDDSSFQGKVVGRLIELARKHAVKVYVVAGESSIIIKDANAMGVDRLSSLVEFAPSKQLALQQPEAYLPLALAKMMG